MAKQSFKEITKVEINQSLPETLSSEEFELLAAMVLTDENAIVNINIGIPGIAQSQVNIKEYVNSRRTLHEQQSLNVFSKNVVFDLSGTINVSNAMEGIATALHSQFPNLTINVNNDGQILWFKDPEIFRILKGIYGKDVFYVSDFNKGRSISFQDFTTIEYFNEYVVFGTDRISTFYNCRALKEVTLPSAITKCPSFYYCQKLETVNLDNIEEIESSGFSNCYELKINNIGNKIKSLASNTFYRCRKLQVSDLPSSLKIINDNAFRESGISISVLRDQFESIGLNVFQGCPNITSMTVKTSILNNGMFYTCANLKRIVIESTVKEIPGNFCGTCESLESITLPDSVEVLNNNAFANSSITEINASFANLRYVGTNAFYGATEAFTRKLIKTDAQGKTFIDFRQFEQLNGGNLYIYTGLAFICDYFIIKNTLLSNSGALNGSHYNDRSLKAKKIIYKGTQQEYIDFYFSQGDVATTSFVSALTSNSYDINSTTIGFFVLDENGNEVHFGGDIVVPESCVRMPYGAFAHIINLNSVICPNVTIYYSVVFAYCRTIKRINSKIDDVCYLPKTTSVNDNCFVENNIYNYYFPKIQSITSYSIARSGGGIIDLGENMRNFNSASIGMSNKRLVIRAVNPPTLPGAFSSTPAYVFVPKDSVNAYKAASNWSRYASIIHPIGDSPTDTTWSQIFGSTNIWADYPDGIEPYSNPNLINSYDDI